MFGVKLNILYLPESKKEKAKEKEKGIIYLINMFYVYIHIPL